MPTTDEPVEEKSRQGHLAEPDHEAMMKVLEEIGPDEASEISSDEPAKTEGPGGDAALAEEKKPETPVTEPVKDDSSYEIIHRGSVVRVPKNDAAEFISKGYDYTQKTMALAEQRKDLEAKAKRVHEILDDLENRKSELDAFRARQEEADEDPSARAERRAKQAEDRINEIQNQLNQERNQVQSQARVQRLYESIDTEKKKHEASFSGLTDRAKDRVQRTILMAIAGGSSVEDAVREASEDFGHASHPAAGSDTSKKDAEVRKKIDNVKKAPVPGKGIPAATRQIKLGKDALTNGEAERASLEFLRGIG